MTFEEYFIKLSRRKIEKYGNSNNYCGASRKKR